MSDRSLVSIVLPTHNGTRYLDESIKSCLSQSYSRLELIVVDDCSTDETPELLRAIDDPRVSVARHDTNRGLPDALNTGFGQARGEYLTWTSDDNLYAADALQTMVALLDERPEVDFVYADYWTIDEQGAKIELILVDPPCCLIDRNGIGACFLYRREVYDALGGYDASARLVEDYEYWLRLSQRFTMLPLHEPLYYYRVHTTSLTSRSGVIHKRLRLGTVIKRQRFGLSWRRYWLEMARIDIDEAFACYRDGDFRRIPGLVLRGVARNPAWLTNLGVSSIAARSLLHIGRWREANASH